MNYVASTVRPTPLEHKQLLKLAKMHNKSFSRYLIDTSLQQATPTQLQKTIRHSSAVGSMRLNSGRDDIRALIKKGYEERSKRILGLR